MSKPENRFPRALAGALANSHHKSVDPADLWDQKVAEGLSPDEATAFVARIHGPPRSAGPAPSPGGDAGPASLVPTREERQAQVADQFRAVDNLRQGMFLPNFSDEARGAAAAVGALIPGGASPREAYVRARDEDRASVAQFEREHPIAGVGGKLAGALLTAKALPTGAAALQQALAKVPKVGTTAARAVPSFRAPQAGAAGMRQLLHDGAALGAAAGAGAAESLSDVPGEAALGAVGGMAGGALVRGVTSGGSLAADKLGLRGKVAEVVNALAERGNRGVAVPAGGKLMHSAGGTGRTGAFLSTIDDRAREMLLADAERAGLTLDDVEKAALQAAATGKPLTYMEIVGQPAMRRARSVRTIPSEGSRVVDEAVEARVTDREAGLLPRLRQNLAQRLGLSPEDADLTAEQLKAARKKNARPLYDKLDTAPPITDPEVLSLLDDDAFQGAYEAAARIARRDGLQVPDLATARQSGIPVRVFDYLKQGLDDVIEAGAANGKFRGRNEARQLRRMLSGAVGKADDLVVDESGQKIYQQARRQYAGDSAVMKAFEDGGKDFLSPKVPAARMARRMEAMSDAEKDLYRRSIFDAVYGKIGGYSRGKDLTQVLGVPNVEEKLRVAFGGDEAAFRGLLDDLDLEGRIVETRRFVKGGSQTADKLTDQSELVGQVLEVGGEALQGKWLEAATRLATNRLDAVAQGVTRQTADALAPRLTAGAKGDPEKLQQLIAELRKAQERIAQRRGTKEGVRRAGSVFGGLLGSDF